MRYPGDDDLDNPLGTKYSRSRTGRVSDRPGPVICLDTAKHGSHFGIFVLDLNRIDLELVKCFDRISVFNVINMVYMFLGYLPGNSAGSLMDVRRKRRRGSRRSGLWTWFLGPRWTI